ncbi:MAG: 4-hydroxy-tetrahydrodipicolinate synthase [Verrucomicrobiae bacterium]|nr:4-hydroxy-tetrahydrodipicolinate synthase [Verrucomicrobiae bacterium]
MIVGTYTALVTPFRDGAVDEKALAALVEWQIESGVDGLVPVGTTGESPTLDFKEHVRVIEAVVEFTRRRVKVIGGSGANATAEAIELTRAAEKAGADGSLQVAPYYNKPTQEGLYRHFKAIAAASKLPLVLYSIPGRCGIEIGVETCRRLAADCPTVVAIKEAGGTPDRVSRLRAALPSGFAVLSGDDSMTLPFMSVGAVGVISVASNVVPREVTEMVCAYAAGRLDAARMAHARLADLFKDLFIETNPIPVKAALVMLGKIREEYRLPLCEMGRENRARLEKTLRALGLLG